MREATVDQRGLVERARCRRSDRAGRIGRDRLLRGWIWSPDDSELLGRSTTLASGVPMVVLDAAGGPVRTAPWNAISDPTWQ
jgi:hypothetical protein